MLDDRQLLRRYATDGSEAAFGQLVGRHLNLVYSAALRRTGGDTHLAQDVAQLVFTDLARKARSLPADAVLAGWLHRATHYTAAQLLRTERRRVAREQEAVAMNTPAANPVWEQICPLLDEALDRLDAADRDAVLLRYFEHKSAKEIGQTLGTSEDAAQKRVSRAVERLREFFVKRGVTIGASGLVALISANAVQAAPVGLTTTISTAAVLAAKTIVASAPKAIAMTTLLKTAIGAALAALVGTGVYEARQTSHLRDQVQILQQQQTPLAEQFEQLSLAYAHSTNQLAELLHENERLNRNTADLIKLRRQIGELQSRNNKLQGRIEQERVASSASQTNSIHFEWPYLTKTACHNAGLDTVAHSLETFLWALNSGDEQALAAISTKDGKGNPKRLTGLSTDFKEMLIGFQPLEAGVFSKTGSVPDFSRMSFRLLAECFILSDRGYGRSLMPLLLTFRNEDGAWKFDGGVSR
jgi:RNA polymerase sigma factor (sigma-70 family)